MTRISEAEAKAFWISVNSVSKHENITNTRMWAFRDNLWSKFVPMWLVVPKKKKNKTEEDNDAEKVCSWLKINKYRFVHTPNESWVGWKLAMIQGIKKKRMWLQTWFPDFSIFLKNWKTLYVELKKKRRKKEDWTYYALSTDWIHCSDEQKDWIEYLKTRPLSFACFSFWFEQTIKYIQEAEKR